MEKEDFRIVDDKTRSSFRKRAIELHKKGVKKGEIALLFGVNKNTVSNWFKHFEETGNFKFKKKGSKSEDKKLPSAIQENQIQKMIVEKMPDQFKLDFALWISKATP